ncbi:hypothetical protein Gorai_021629 [Gossypium raimondii]|uniref:Uncharacterized protein n=1 Tax=Gossypium raimondii TaxID=29730 RepID=A0A7J8NQV6_GOSRA|nr:hypothetical protein [Gossypium raimondii]
MAEVGNNTAVEIGLAGLSLDEGEDEGWRADLSGEEMEEGMDLCAVGEFLEYDTKAVGRGYRGFMQIRVRIDIRGPLKQRKKIILSPKKFQEGQLWGQAIGFERKVMSLNWMQYKGLRKEGGNVDPNVVLVDEDSSMEIREGEKRPRKFVFSTISMGMDSEQIVGESSNARISDLLVGSVGQSSRAL